MTTLLVGISVRAAAQSAVSSGHEIIALDAFGDMDLSRICRTFSLRGQFSHLAPEPGSLTEKLGTASRDLDFDQVVYGSGFENHPELVRGWEEEGRVVLGNPSRVLEGCRDWRRLFDFLRSRGVSCPETHVVEGLGSAEIADLDSARYIVKPVRSGGGHSILPLDRVLDDPGLTDLWADRAALIQELIPGTAASISFISSGKAFLPVSTTLQLIGTDFSRFKYAGNVAPLDVSQETEEKMVTAARLVSREFDLIGSNGIDFCVSDGEPFVLEINPRIQGSLEVVEGAAGVSVFDLHLRACRGEEIPSRVARSQTYWGRRIVYAPRDLRMGDLSRIRFVKDVPLSGSSVDERSPICTVVARSDSSEGCVKRLLDRENRVISLFTDPVD